MKHTGTWPKDLPVDVSPAWMDGDHIPAQVQEKARACEADLAIAQWQKLSPLQRFALIKLSRPSHENRNFVPALQEFLAPSPIQ